MGTATFPVSVQLVARYGDEATLFRLAGQLEKARSWFDRKPPADAQHPRALLGRIMLEGRLVPRDVAKAVELLLPWSQWDYDTRLLILRVLAENPDVQLARPETVLYDATEFAELGEPGAMDALIALKLSRHAQFADATDGCALVERAAKLGRDMARHMEQCRSR
jgi:hypothetical protein